ncbi:hypothetical protein EVAR_79710_1 [Eumeta japonica]|uniref:Uncharacterized protein n=1 Tax=Eumeta variegata TaxID=151549 RepID=A0A4C1T9B6_EUMVA|nr:hypothetical protein EVAR_79710_1 [Eumeta japonica]
MLFKKTTRSISVRDRNREKDRDQEREHKIENGNQNGIEIDKDIDKKKDERDSLVAIETEAGTEIERRNNNEIMVDNVTGFQIFTFQEAQVRSPARLRSLGMRRHLNFTASPSRNSFHNRRGPNRLLRRGGGVRLRHFDGSAVVAAAEVTTGRYSVHSEKILWSIRLFAVAA